MSEHPSALQPQWCLIGNIVQERPYGPYGQETRRGTKHFAAGAKVYCLPSQWGDGYEKIIVIGRRRSAKRFISIVISSVWVTNWRSQVVYSPTVLQMIQSVLREVPGWQNWDSQEHVEAYVSGLKKRG